MTLQASSPPLPAPADSTGRHAEKLSDLLERLARDAGDKMTLGEVTEALDGRSFGAMLLIFSLPNLMPLPPGATLILGLPMLFVAWQMLIGYDKIWMPKSLADYSLSKQTFQSMVAKVIPWLRRAEAWVRPRNWPINGPVSERLFGLFALVLSLVCIIPILFGNWPPAFAIAVLGVAHTERDGNCLAVGIVAGVIAIIVALLIISLAGTLLVSIFESLFG